MNIYTQGPGLSAEEVESLITKKIETFMSGIKDAELVRSISLPGLSYISVFFKDRTDVFFARRLVMERLLDVKGYLPQDYNPVMGSNSSGFGNVLIYALTSKNQTLTQLKTLQEWKIRPLIRAVEGVEEISQWGPDRAFIVRVNPGKMMLYKVDYKDIIDDLKTFSGVTGGGYSKTPEGDLVVRGIGYYTDIHAVERTPVKVIDGNFIKISDLGVVEDGEMPNRRGAFTLNEEEVQGNIVLKRINTNTKEVVSALKEEIENIRKILPKDVEIKILYDQSYLTEKAVNTIEKAKDCHCSCSIYTNYHTDGFYIHKAGKHKWKSYVPVWVSHRDRTIRRFNSCSDREHPQASFS